MKKLFYALFLTLFVCISCSKEEQIQEDQTIDNFARNSPGKDKINLCHYNSVNGTWKIINPSNKSLDAHLNHGDVLLIDSDGDGYVSELNECVPGGDCDDSDATINPGTEVFDFYPVYNPITGKTWMDRNLGASQVATNSTDAASYGDLYQWGRGSDGHQIRTFESTSTLSGTDTPGHGDFILSSSDPYDWRNPQNDNLWQGVNGVNNPCPCGYRIPTETELNAERVSWSSNDPAGAFASPLKLPVAGYRDPNGGIGIVGLHGLYWSSTVSGTFSRSLRFGDNNAIMFPDYRGDGFSVRCIKD